MSVLKSFIDVKKHVKQPSKDGTNPQFKSGYVTLDGVIKSIDDAIIESKEPFAWWQEVNDNVVYTAITDGEDTLKIQGFPLLAVQNNKAVNLDGATPQALGSGLTYAKRYSLAMAFGISSDVDDDGNGAQDQKYKSVNKSGQEKPKNPLHSEFGKLAKKIESKNNIDEKQVYSIISGQFGLQVNEFMDFVKLSDNQKQTIVTFMQNAAQ
ncbi:ERF family protein [Leuconostoc gelidum subsp. gasicomitatum]|uniref:ERF family protein n=1 Tax=Leuconostoc gasicomitatum TaxID=115778 RepID=UPI001CC71C34|nr:ERF family protein [Leuconostoc gasicomitatum]MBZ5943938.1 ERF family protein [Leuconostoc gasicomitatum]MBZ5973048.1 ERF family protein [Leuconostoc gasicomitatum]MBZ5998514.1 ERF family protein [Leuconostoc gasicomitatum]